MKRRRIRHRIEHTRNKHSRAVFRDETIIIRLARNLSHTQEQEHIQTLLRRMTQRVLKADKLHCIDPFSPLLNGNQSLTVTLPTGRRYHIALKPGGATRVERHSSGWVITVGPLLRRPGFHRLLWKLLSDAETPHTIALVKEINERTLGVRVKDVRLKFAGSQWGSCSPRCTIMINAALLCMPPEILQYIIVHELAHVRFQNHSHAFWREVERAMPTYREAKKRLLGYRLPPLAS
ncbi:hypothetical protein COU80_02835 [Candidatus Peregrinibacteria bacterium CG10_big_fil_rev_8_21_14_0_10_55_24]|nr:MAG: hypothetical protein COU80_02835 [Candidatus Peregrinibacteria bacterium CG10_big_fil_rev_8_21_14_0_10_55_24]